eukprot:gene15645-biopygen12745
MNRRTTKTHFHSASQGSLHMLLLVFHSNRCGRCKPPILLSPLKVLEYSWSTPGVFQEGEQDGGADVARAIGYNLA